MRIVYYFHSESMPIFLLSAYSKGEKADLSPVERNTLRRLTLELVQEYAGRKMQ